MIDLEQKNPETLTFPTRVGERHLSALRADTRGLRTVYWFYELRARMAASTIADLQDYIEPVVPSRRKDVQRRWGHYKGGTHSPCARVVSLAERVLPGSSQVFQSDLWECLRSDRDPAVLARRLLGQTNADGNVLLGWMLRPQGPPSNQLSLSIPRYHRLILLGSLEALAVLVICTRLAVMLGRRSLAQQHFLRVYDFLIVHFHHLQDRGIASHLAQHINSLLSPGGEMMPHEICRGRLDYLEAAERLDVAFRQQLAHADRVATGHELARVKLEFFQSAYWS